MRVEWVTVQVRWSQARGGRVKVEEGDGEGEGGEEEVYLVGVRRMMALGAMVVWWA